MQHIVLSVTDSCFPLRTFSQQHLKHTQGIIALMLDLSMYSLCMQQLFSAILSIDKLQMYSIEIFF